MPNVLTDAFRRGMRELGYEEGKTVEFHFRSAEGRPERFPAVAAEVVKLNPDVILSGGGTPSARAAMRATKSIPMSFRPPLTRSVKVSSAASPGLEET